MARKSKTRILYATPEVVPFASTGGLGEVAGSLPAALNRLDGRPFECRVIMPLYKTIKGKFISKMKFLGEANVPMCWKNQYAGLYKMGKRGVTYYFIDNEQFFCRDNLYGYFDDGERFAFFAKAIFECLPLMDFVPDIIHANDWQTALLPVYQNTIYHRDFLKTVLTIHNVRYQGSYGNDIYESVLDIPNHERHFLEMSGGVNYMKGGIECSHAFTTVSPTYAAELQTPGRAHGMDAIIRRNNHKLCGILNGINAELYDPQNDPLIAAAYDESDISGKAVCKAELRKMLGLPTSAAPLVVMITRMARGKGIDIVMPMMDGLIASTGIQFVILGSGESEYENYFRGLSARHPDNVRALIQFDIPLSHILYAGADMIMVPSLDEPCGLTQMIGCRYGTIPIVRETGGLKDSIKDCSLGQGNGFVFREYNSGDLYGALERATHLYENSQQWDDLVRYALSCDFSWGKSAAKYGELYERITAKND